MAADMEIRATRFIRDRRVGPVGDDRDLRRLDLERLELPGASLRVLCRHRIPHNAHRRVVGHDPLGDPELPFGLLFVLPIAHRDVDRLARKCQVDDEFGRPIPLACGIDRVHPESNRLTALELIVQQTVAWVARWIEEDGVAKDDQALARRLTSEG
jgi:hypothetical protein